MASADDEGGVQDSERVSRLRRLRYEAKFWQPPSLESVTVAWDDSEPSNPKEFQILDRSVFCCGPRMKHADMKYAENSSIPIWVSIRVCFGGQDHDVAVVSGIQ